MSQKLARVSIVAAAAMLCGAAFAQTSSVTLYGSLDQYLSYMKSSSGKSLTSLNDGSTLRSRIGFRGVEDLGNGLLAKFQLEHGLSADSGTQADSARFFDRQAWIGVASPTYGEFRLGRQNGIVFGRGDFIDYSSRTLGSIVNNFGTPSRYDNDISWQSPRWAGVMLEAHYALGETTAGSGKQAIYQLGVDYVNGPFRVGYADITGKANPNSAVRENVVYRNLYANYDYGQGKVYLVAIRSNNSTSSTTTSNNGAAIMGNVGGLVNGTNTATNPTIEADLKRFYNIFQISADYRITPELRVGALYGVIKDTSDSGRDAKGGSVGAYYSLSKRTTLMAMYESMSNDTNAGFRPSGSAGVNPNFTGADVNGQRIHGMQVGVIHRF